MDKHCTYCWTPEYAEHKGFCLTLTEGTGEEWVERCAKVNGCFRTTKHSGNCAVRG